MIVVIAGPDDIGAQLLVDRPAWAELAMLRPEDLSRPGWIHRPDRPASGRAVIDGRVVPTAEITAVLSRRACIASAELDWLHPEDRDYAAIEMTAFLVAWLTWLPCPVVNRPQPGCLCGPSWSATRWRAAAAMTGLAQAPSGSLPVGFVNIVGAYAIGAPSAETAARARQLATAARVELLSVGFTAGDEAFTGASLWPDLALEPVIEALEGLLGLAEPAEALVAAG